MLVLVLVVLTRRRRTQKCLLRVKLPGLPGYPRQTTRRLTCLTRQNSFDSISIPYYWGLPLIIPSLKVFLWENRRKIVQKEQRMAQSV